MWIDRHLGMDYGWPGNVRELEQCVINVLMHGKYHPIGPVQPVPHRDLAQAVAAGALTRIFLRWFDDPINRLPCDDDERGDRLRSNAAGWKIGARSGRDAEIEVGERRELRVRRALAALYDTGAGGRPVAAYSFLGLCVLLTVPTLLFPELYGVFGGIEPRRHWWQTFTAVFEHGWPGFHGSIHLALNVFLILECGRPCERLLGTPRFVVLSVMAWLAGALTQTLTEGVNGSSMVIWSWGPPLFAALVWAKRHDAGVAGTAAYGRIRGVLVLMYVVVVVLMALLPFLFGWRGNPLAALLMGNLFHMVATAAGIGFAIVFARTIRGRLARLTRPTTSHRSP